jgi:hypothetical protein
VDGNNNHVWINSDNNDMSVWLIFDANEKACVD